MTHLHWTFVAVAYALTAAAIVIEIVSLVRRRRRALARVASERDFEDHDSDA